MGATAKIRARAGPPEAASSEQTRLELRIGRDQASIRVLGSLWEARAELATRDVEDLATELESLVGDVQDDSIELLYAELRALLNEDASESNEARCVDLLDRLRRLQENEAAEMEQYFEQHRPLPKGSGTNAVGRADELLAKYEDPATSDTARERAYNEAS